MLEKLKKAFYSKAFLVFVIVTLLGALGLEMSEDVISKIVCLLPGVSGCV